MNKAIKELINNKQNNYIIKLLKIASDKIILPLRGNLKKDQINTKNRIDDFVTQADKMVEEYLSFELKKVLSDSVVIGEEECSENPNLLKSLSKECLIWTCDPIDGTYNYINMSPNFCTMVALCFKEKPIDKSQFSKNDVNNNLKYCHSCGKETETTVAEPLCKNCK